MPDHDKAKDCDPTVATDADRRREAELWKERNAEAIASYNERVAREGLLLAKYRRF